jgi:hypothetical protein
MAKFNVIGLAGPKKGNECVAHDVGNVGKIVIRQSGLVTQCVSRLFERCTEKRSVRGMKALGVVDTNRHSASRFARSMRFSERKRVQQRRFPQIDRCEIKSRNLDRFPMFSA